MRDDDLEERLRRAFHLQLDGAELPATDRQARARRGARAPFGLLAAAASIVLVAVLVGSRLAGPGETPAGVGPVPATAGASSNAVLGSGTPGSAATGESTPVAIPSTAGSAGVLGPGPNLTAVSPAPAQPPATAKTATATVRVAPPPVAATLPPAPTPTPTSAPVSASGTVVVTLAQAGGTIYLAVGRQLVLQLGSTYQWAVQVGGSGVLAPASVPLQAGQQGAWIAERTGTAQLQVIGNPFCLQSKPPCAMPSRAFTVIVVVR